jgi:hypothetical protein
MAGEFAAFSCCHAWNQCSIEGYCVRKDADIQMKRCSLADRLFINPRSGWNERWKQRAMETNPRLGVGELVDVGPNQRNRSETIAASLQRRSKVVVREHTIHSERSDSNSERRVEKEVYVPNGFQGLSTYLIEGELVMKNVKVVEAGSTYELISWMHKDLANYGIREKATSQILEQFAPTKKLKGWDLRKQVIAKLREYNDKGAPEEKVARRSITIDTEDLQIGNVLVYYNPILDKNVYCRIVKLDEYLVHYVNDEGIKFCFMYDRLQIRIDKSEIWVIKESEVPEGIEFKVAGIA